jgi:hypothetical protein
MNDKVRTHPNSHVFQHKESQVIYDPIFALLFQRMWHLLPGLVGHGFCGLLVRIHVQGVDLALFVFLNGLSTPQWCTRAPSGEMKSCENDVHES